MPYIRVPYDASISNKTRTQCHVAIELALQERRSQQLTTNSQRNAAAIIVEIPNIDEPLKKAAMSGGIGHAGQGQHAERVALREIIKEAMFKKLITNIPNLSFVKQEDFKFHIDQLITRGAKFFIFTERTPCSVASDNPDPCQVFLEELLPGEEHKKIYYAIPHHQTKKYVDNTLLVVLPIALGTLNGRNGPPLLHDVIKYMDNNFRKDLKDKGKEREEAWVKIYLEEQHKKMKTTTTGEGSSDSVSSTSFIAAISHPTISIEEVSTTAGDRFIAMPVDPDGDCGFTAFGITREQAIDLLLYNLINTQVVELLKQPLREIMFNENFRNYIEQRNMFPEYIRIFDERVVAQRNNNIVLATSLEQQLEKYANDISFLSCYINYDIKDKKVDVGWAHPAVLQAIAIIQNLRLNIFIKDSNSLLIPHEYYPTIGSQNAQQEINLLFVNGNHFERLEPRDFKNEAIPKTAISSGIILSDPLKETVVTTRTPEEILTKLGAELVTVQSVTSTNSSQESTLSEGSLPLWHPLKSEEPPTAKPKPSPSSRHGSPGHHGSN
ncbi:MAG: OTU domain-containing protein [Gammaproteobacteria bacterium]